MRIKLTAISLALLGLSAGVAAQVTGGDFSVSGYGTLGYVQTNTDQGTYTIRNIKFGAKSSGDMNNDSKLGLQVSTKFNDTFSGVAQVLAIQDGAGNYGPNLEWAFVKAKLGSNYGLRVGRMGGPFFMTSDFRNVGYTNLTMRTSPEVYGLVPVRSFDGADLIYQGGLGDSTLTAQLYAGEGSATVGTDIKVLTKNMAGLSVTVDMGAITFRAGHLQTTLGTEGVGLAGFNQVVGGLQQVSAVPGLGSLGTLSTNLAIDGKRATFTGIGATMEVDNWVGSAEYVKRKSDSLYVSDNTAWNTTLGYRMDKVTPYVSLSSRTLDSVGWVTAPSTAGYPAQVQGTVAALIGGVNTGILTDGTQRSVALGARWDAGKSYALKAEYIRMSIPAGANGLLKDVATPTGRFASDTTVNALNLGLDFVF